MLTYLQRWQVANCLYRLQQRRDRVTWVAEHDLIIWISGVNIQTHIGRDTWIDRVRAHLAYFFYRVNNHDQLFIKLRNVIHECEDPNVNWIMRTSGDDGISDHLALTARGREVYPYSHLLGLIFGNSYVKWGITTLVVWVLAHQFNIIVEPK